MKRLMLAIMLTSALALATDFVLTFPPARSQRPLDGRLLLLLSTDPSAEPRLQINDSPNTQLVFGLDVENWKPGTLMKIGDNAYGYPIRSLSQLTPGEYTAQALLNRYETFRLADGRVVKLPPDRGEGQQWHSEPGNIYSQPLKLHIGPGGAPVNITLDQEIPHCPRPKTPNTSSISASRASGSPSLGHGHVPGRDRPGARRLRLAPRGALSR